MRALLLFCLLSASLTAQAFTRAELQKFIDDAIAAGGGEVILPPGIHELDQPLVIKNAAKFRLIGLEAEDTFLQPVKTAAKAFPLIRIEGTASELHLAKITFTTANPAFSKTPLIEVLGTTEKDQSTSFQIDRCFFENHPGPAIVITDAKDSRITASTFMDLGGPAIHVTGQTTALTLQHNHLTRCGTPAIHLEASTTNCQLIANELHNGTLKIEGQSHQLQANDLRQP